MARRRSRRSISDIVAVLLLILIAIVAAVLIYAWLSGLLGGVRSSSSTAAMYQRAEITAVSASYINTNSSLVVTAYVYNSPGSAPVRFASAYATFTNGTIICNVNVPSTSSSASSTETPSPIPSGSSGEVWFTCSLSSQLPRGIPIVVTLVTDQGVPISASGIVRG